MLARCAHCQKPFETDHFGVQACPHCGGQVHLADPSAPAPTEPVAPPPPAAPPQAAPPPPPGWGPGAPGGWQGYPPGYPAGAPGAAWAVGEADAPFARRRELGLVRSYVDTWKLACLRPAEFFRSVKVDSPGSAVLFGVVAMTIGSWFQTLYGAVMGAATRGMMQEMIRQVPQGDQLRDAWVFQWMSGTTALGTTAQLVAAPFLSAIGILVSAALYQLVLLILRASPRGFAATLTVVGYAEGVMILGAAPVPGLANLVAWVWATFLIAIGFREAQRTTSGKAWAAALWPFLAFCLCCCGAMGLFASGVASLPGLRGHGG